jgi:hypothetical protein
VFFEIFSLVLHQKKYQMELRTKTKKPEHQELGVAFRVGSKAMCSIYEEGSQIMFDEDIAEIVIGIGTKHVAKVYMSLSALDALREGEKITTFKKLKHKRR